MEFNKTTLIYAIGGVILLLLIIFIALYGFSAPQVSSSQIIMWGFEKPDVYDEILRNLQSALSVKVEYVQKSPDNYEKELLNAMASGQGPDIFPVHHTWLPQYKDKLASAPGNLMALKAYNETFVDVVSQDFIADGNIFAAPLYVDTLALYWNKDFFNTANIAEPPKNWDQFLEDVSKLTVIGENGEIARAGAAIGSALNVDSATDILSLLMLQTGTKMTQVDKSAAAFQYPITLNGESYDAGRASLDFYTQFVFPQKKESSANSSYCWSPRMENSLESFSRGRAAMVIYYSSAISNIKAKAPYLNFSIAMAPQIKDSSIAVNYADYWGIAAWTGSKNKTAAWQAIFFLTDKTNSQKYLEAVGKPTARRDLVNWQKDDSLLGVFANQALSARSWYQIDNVAIKEIFSQMIESVVHGQVASRDAIESAANKVTTLMRENK